MSGTNLLTPSFVEFIPDELEEGFIYISPRYSTASHRCCCGCGREVVTPLNPAKWRLAETDGKVSLTPSVGNWSFPCQSHYWISGNRVTWAPGMAPEVIAAVQARDRRDAAKHIPQRPRLLARTWSWLAEMRRRLAGCYLRWKGRW